VELDAWISLGRRRSNKWTLDLIICGPYKLCPYSSINSSLEKDELVDCVLVMCQSTGLSNLCL
jgi:hypothetical protein